MSKRPGFFKRTSGIASTKNKRLAFSWYPPLLKELLSIRVLWMYHMIPTQ